MDPEVRKLQKRVLAVFSKKAKDFALAGGTALELFYLKHRFSADLDFFSPKYNLKEIEGIISALKEEFGKTKVKFESEFTAPDRARVKFYSVKSSGVKRPLKIDLVEDIMFNKPQIRKFNGIRVYSAKNIYLQKITAITGSRPEVDDVGRQIMQGRRQARDAFDVYMLSKKIEPLHVFLKSIPSLFQRGLVHWYRTFSRQDLKLSLLDLDIYDKEFDSKGMIIYMEKEIKQFISEALE